MEILRGFNPSRMKDRYSAEDVMRLNLAAEELGFPVQSLVLSHLDCQHGQKVVMLREPLLRVPSGLNHTKNELAKLARLWDEMKLSLGVLLNRFLSFSHSDPVKSAGARDAIVTGVQISSQFPATEIHLPRRLQIITPGNLFELEREIRVGVFRDRIWIPPNHLPDETRIEVHVTPTIEQSPTSLRFTYVSPTL